MAAAERLGGRGHHGPSRTSPPRKYRQAYGPTQTGQPQPMSNEVDRFWMDYALSLAAAAALRDEVPVGAVVVYDGRLIGTGMNLRETMAQAKAHAEFLAIEEASRFLGAWRLQDCTLYVTLEPCL